MGLLANIIENDLDNCNEALGSSKELKAIEKEFYQLMENKGDETFSLHMEEIFGSFTAHAIRIAYLQGLKDFNELFIDLKKDIPEILT